MSEAQEQAAVIEWCGWKRIPVFHVPNGGYRNPREAAHLKAQGVKSGVPDLVVPVPNREYHGLFIEMKTGNNKPSDNQLKWLSLLEENGYRATVCWGASEAIGEIQSYMRDR